MLALLIRCLVMVGATLAFALTTTPAFAWKPGNQAIAWDRGATLNVFVDAIPADAPAGTSGAIDDAIKEWNDAQAPFGGLKLVRAGATKANADIHISWNKDPDGSVTNAKDDFDKTNNGFTKNTVRMETSLKDVNVRGVTRDLKHEFGHVEGLGHSAMSALMKADAYSSTPGKGPSIDDLNSPNPFIDPTNDDKAGKKFLFGTTDVLSRLIITANAIFDAGLRLWRYLYNLQASNAPGLTQPVTQFTLDLPPGTSDADFSAVGVPSGWRSDFFDGNVQLGGRFDDGEGPSPSLFSFSATSAGFGIAPGEMLDFEIDSSFAPVSTRAFTNSPNFDSQEFTIPAPAAAPEPSSLALFGIALLGLFSMGVWEQWNRKPA